MKRIGREEREGWRGKKSSPQRVLRKKGISERRGRVGGGGRRSK